MQYMLIMSETHERFAERDDPAHAESYWGGWNAYIGALGAAGVIVNGDGLQPPHTATTVRIRDGQREVQDGPFADTKESLGGYFVIEVPDLDTALEVGGTLARGQLRFGRGAAGDAAARRLMDAARHAAERVARDSYGRLLALLAARTRDLAGAEDALAEALAAALRSWPERGVPDNPEAWLMTAARRTLGHGARHRAVREAAAEALLLAADGRASHARGPFPDERLKLLFVCAHPAIDAGLHTPLMLQVVLGLDAARIAAAFLTAPTAMAQRLVRAKAKIRDAGIRFAEPDAHDLAPRRDAVLAAIYAAYGTGWDEAPGSEASEGLTEEAIYLARLVVGLMPDDSEPRGLLALLLHCEARRQTRRDATGGYVPLAEQDARRWSRTLIVEAETVLTEAAQLRRPGRFQTEAAIQSLHAQRSITGHAQHDALALLYDVLVTQTPAIGAHVARAAAHAQARGPEAGLALLDALPADRVASYQPYWATRAALLSAAGQNATEAYDRAIGLTTDSAVRTYLAAGRAPSKSSPSLSRGGGRPKV